MQRRTAIDRFGRNHLSVVLVTGMLLGLSACMEVAEQSEEASSDADRTLGAAAGVEPGVEANDVSGNAAVPWTGAIPTAEDCASVDAWMVANEATLPTGYDEISRFPVAYRRSIFGALPAEAKSRLWQQHFEAYRAAHPELTGEQGAFIDKLSATFSPELYVAAAGGEPSEEVDATIEALEAEAATLFSVDEQYALMANLGPDESTAENDTVASIAPRARACECSSKSDWCNRRGTRLGCAKGHDGCRKPRFKRCGTGFAHKCDGLCKHY